ncbi:MAG: hypothetical protein JW908_00565 [Anaerolineales bacterium]|nr:hypothetical protein [Anaerolineales bacterium]
MAKQAGRWNAIYYAGYDLSGLSNQFDFSVEFAEADTTGFLEGAENSIPDEPKGSAALTVFLDPDTDKSHDALKTPGSYTDHHLCILLGQNAAPTIGDPALAMVCKQFSYNAKFARKSAVMADVAVNSAGELPDVNGIVLANTTITNTTTFSVVDHSESTEDGGAGYLQILTPASTDTYVIKIQHSSDNITYSDLITFTADGSARISERGESGDVTVNRYMRVLATRTGSAGDDLKLCVVFARQGIHE